MQTSELPHDVEVLLRDHIESYEELELLLVMRGNKETDSTAETLSNQLHTPLSLVHEALDALQSAGFIEARGQGAETRYAYVNQSETVEATINRLAVAYGENPIPIVKLMSAKSLERLRTAAQRTFADAFLLRKDKNRG